MTARSIGERLGRAGSLAVKTGIAREWADDWRSEQEDLLAALETHFESQDHRELYRAIRVMRAVTEKRFNGLHGVIAALGEDDPSGA